MRIYTRPTSARRTVRLEPHRCHETPHTQHSGALARRSRVLRRGLLKELSQARARHAQREHQSVREVGAAVVRVRRRHLEERHVPDTCQAGGAYLAPRPRQDGRSGAPTHAKMPVTDVVTDVATDVAAEVARRRTRRCRRRRRAPPRVPRAACPSTATPTRRGPRRTYPKPPAVISAPRRMTKYTSPRVYLREGPRLTGS